MRPKSRLYEEYAIPTEGKNFLYAVAMMPKQPRRVVFMPPLIGAGAAQAPVTFRNMTRHGCILLSFQYRGHPHCSGVFDLDSSVVDTEYSMHWAKKYAEDRGLPLHALTQCYGTVPLLAQFKGGDCEVVFKSISLGSALVQMDQIMQIDDFVSYLSRNLGIELDRSSLLTGLIEHKFDWNGPACRGALTEYLTDVFPELKVTRESFEELSYERLDLESTLLQFLQSRYFDNVGVPRSIPCHLFVGLRDTFMKLDTREGRQRYERQVRKIIPHAVVHYYDIDHFGRGPGREPLIEVMADVCEQSETSSVNVMNNAKPSFFGVRVDETVGSILE
ncbi:MAG: hypothetical protein JW959_07775 [Pirellulales bacterium]|nr:hypothetical protein [Pirellulales bacterium]